MAWGKKRERRTGITPTNNPHNIPNIGGGISVIFYFFFLINHFILFYFILFYFIPHNILIIGGGISVIFYFFLIILI